MNRLILIFELIFIQEIGVFANNFVSHRFISRFFSLYLKFALILSEYENSKLMRKTYYPINT